MRVRKNKSILTLLLAFMIFISTFCVNGFTFVKAADYPFDQTNVLDDLEQSEDFNLIEYPWDYTGLIKSPAVINFVEWCYSPFNPGDFALYIYFYNPQNLKIETGSYSNKVQMAVEYDQDLVTSDAMPTDYDTFNLIFCNKSERPNYEGLFYKFRVVDRVGSDGKYIFERVYSGQRRYDISGLTLATTNGAVKEYTVGGTYVFEGYAAGYGPNENSESTLQCTDFRALETIRLEVEHTNYRTKTSAKGDYYRNDINSVYFSVPNKYLENYGSLQKIKAEWHEYETMPIFVFDDLSIKAKFDGVLGKDAKSTGFNYGIATTTSYHTDPITPAKFHLLPNAVQYNVVNHSTGYTFWDIYGADTISNYTKLYYSFYHDEDLAFVEPDDILVSGRELRDHIESYNQTAIKGYLPVGNGKISADLFKTDLSEDRAFVPYVGEDIHHKKVEIDADDKFDVLVEGAGKSGWELFWKYGFGASDIAGAFLEDVSPIEYENISNYIEGSDSVVSDILLINEYDVADFKTYYTKAQSNDETTVLFRFSCTDYFTHKSSVFDHNGTNGGEYMAGVGTAMVASQSVFLDFKIIQLTFMDEDEAYKIIPVTQDPIDIYNDITGGGTGTTPFWLKLKEWFDDFLQTLGAVGVLILGLMGLGVILFVSYLVIKAFSQLGGVLGTILTIALIIAICVGIYFYGAWIFNVIAQMGGLW